MTILDQLNARLADASAQLDFSNKEVERIKRELKNAKESRAQDQDKVNMIANNIRELRDGEYQPTLFEGDEPPSEESP
jgi:hypothetical protein